ncbi:MAG: tyrosine-type recombinase/integrase [Pseudomonadota bacterium]
MKHKRQYPGASPYRDRHGVRRWRFRAKGFSAELGVDYGSEDFERRYQAALDRQKTKGQVGSNRSEPGTLKALVASWKRTPQYLGWEDITRITYGRPAEEMCKKHGHKRVAHLQTRHVEALMADKAEKPTAANRRRKVLGMLLDHAISLGWRTDNPARNAKPYKIKSTGYHTWTEDEIGRFYARHEPGTTEHTAMTLMLYTGAARIDAVRLGWGNVSSGRISYRRQKTAKQSQVRVDIPIHPELARVLDALPRDSFTFLQTAGGKSRSPNGLGNLIREACDAAGLGECSAHGLRKACARRLAEAGATPHMIAAVTGHATLGEVERYTRAADRAGLADQGFELMADRMNQEHKLTNHPARFAKKGEK